MGNLLFRTYQGILKNKITSILVLLSVAGLLGFLASKISFEDDITSLIPSNEETQRIQKVLKSISFTDKIIVNIEKNPEASVDELTQYATDFIDSIQKTHASYIKNIQGKVADAQVLKTFDFVYDHLPLFLDKTDYEGINQKLSKDSITAITTQNYRTLISPSGIIAKKSILKDPLGLSFIALKKLQQLGVAENFKLKNGFLVNNAETNILLFITPVHPSSATVENKPLSDGLYKLQEKLQKRFNSKVEVSFFGAALVAVANAGQIKSDIQFTVSIAMMLLVILLILFYRAIRLPLILFAPTLFGALLALVFLYLLRPHISAISLGIGAILLGVTLDYALHILTHIRSGRSVKELYEEIAPSILMSSLTTAAAFLCLLFLDSQALQDLGIFAAVSVTGASLFALVFIPVVYRPKTIQVSKKNILDRISAVDLHKNKLAIGFLMLICITSVFTYKDVIFNQDISKLNYESEVLSKARQKLEKLTDIASKSIYLSTYGDDDETVLQRNDSIFKELQQLKQDKDLVNFTSVGSLIKSTKTQKRKINDWEMFWQKQKIDTLQRNLITSGTTLGFKPNTFNAFYGWLRTDFKTIAPKEFETIPALSTSDYIVTDENGTTITSLLKLKEENFDAVTARFKNSENTLLINRKQVNESFLGTLKNDFNSLLRYSLITVLIILLVFYRSLSLTLVTVIPIFLTWFLTVGIMGLLQIEFNIFNIIICSFIFGLGVDYSIFITNGLLAEYRTGGRILPTHKTSIILSVITTIAGVGVMIFAKHPALYTISKVSLIGIFSAAFVSFILQPLLFRLFIGNTRKRPISLRYFIHSVFSFFYFGTIGLLFSLYASIVMKLRPNSVLKENLGFHQWVSKFMGSVLYTNPFVGKKVLNPHGEEFEKPAMIIANHTSFLDILCLGMLHPKMIFLVNDWVYNSPIFGSAAKFVGAYPVSGGVENGEAYLKKKVAQGFSIIAFPEGTRSTSNKIKRFHKGAFYLAEQLHMDILPVLIHGNSEVLPKGSFVIRDGSITVELLPRITPDDDTYGSSYKQQGKLIGAYFRDEFRRLRKKIETATYWHKTVLEHYRFKGSSLYDLIKSDLKDFAAPYKELCNIIGAKETIIHLSEDQGQLDLLLALDSIDRKIYSYIWDSSARSILKHNFLTHQYSKISVFDAPSAAFEITAQVLILNLKDIDMNKVKTKVSQEITTLILLKSSRNLNLAQLSLEDFSVLIQNDTFIVLKKESLK
ncbi:1-acyl-sn-glycerol-3-phosphate acyltransferase [Maribacter sp. R77961]|uniref:1-acyl-sn-glycerol-3-phosphate acyltransferase n=1 Tax=Maribacter sp. R77961 TaxID=3093871 RepID=UPI0037C6BD90